MSMSDYIIAIPMMVNHGRAEKNFEERLRLAKLAGAKRIFLCTCTATDTEENKRVNEERFARMAARVTAEGLEPCAWFNSLGHGYSGIADGVEESPDGLTYMKDLDGRVDPGSNCPMDPKFLALLCDWTKRLAKAGARIIQLDDDFRLGYRPGGPHCCCKHHVPALEQAISRHTGQPVKPFDAAEMKAALTTGGPNPLRDAWLEVQGNAMNNVARAMRQAVNEVDPTVRLTACSCLSVWDVDGTDTLTLAKIFAGDTTKPLARLIGAPYWGALRNYDDVRMATVCEYERLQQHWAAGSGVEVYGEGDAYPRPRYTVPAAYLEALDTVLRADGNGHGILKYMFDYCASPAYETGYYDRHMRSQGLYAAIHAAFDGKKAVGVKVFEPIKTFAASHDPGSMNGRCIPRSIRFVTDNSLAARYDADGQDATVIFDDAAELAGPEQLAHGAILDAHAARILMRRGIDVGLESIGEEVHPDGEFFYDMDEIVSISGGTYLAFTLKPGAKVLSGMHLPADANWEHCALPCVYTYENAAGQRFMVHAFIARKSSQYMASRGMQRGWCRAAQLRSQLEWLARRTPDAVCTASPDLFMLAKRDQNSLTVGLWNFCEDAVFSPKVHLGQNWDALVPVAGTAQLDGRTVTLGDIAPSGFACFTVILDKPE